MSATAEPAIDVRGLNKSFGDKHVVSDLSLRVMPGEIFGFLGPNGSGKTTSIRMLCGLLTPDSGSGTCLGYDIRTQSAQIKRNVGYMTQRFSYWEDLSIEENLDFVARIYEMSDRGQVVQRALESLGLKQRAGQLAGELSGGWKQRLALAASMLHRPRLLLLDEPTAGVDPTARRDFWQELHRLAGQGISVLVSTHYMDEAERCHKLAFISDGKLLVQGTAAEVINSQNLSTWSVHGEHLGELARRLQDQAGVDQTVIFGSALHITGHDGPTLERTVTRVAAELGLQAESVASGIEDVFIYLMNKAEAGKAPQDRD